MRALCSKPFLQEKKLKTIFRKSKMDIINVQNRKVAKDFGFFFAEKRINGQMNLKKLAFISIITYLEKENGICFSFELRGLVHYF